MTRKIKPESLTMEDLFDGRFAKIAQLADNTSHKTEYYCMKNRKIMQDKKLEKGHRR